MGLFDTPPGPFANPGRDGIVNPDKPQHPGGHPGVPGTPGHPGLGHGHVNPNDPRPDRLPVQDFLGNVAMPDGVIPGQPRWK
jgi:hypothetical protein